ncbi:conjugal transfer protein TraD [Flavobacterium collinsii]|nr:conjugal transfer protein TraD [Flavobacterium collinsii]
MEALIVICLLIIIMLLVHDKFQGRISNAEKETGFENRGRNLPDLIGPTKDFKSLLTPHDTNDCHIKVVRDEAHNFDAEISAEQQLTDSQEILVDADEYLPDFEDEEKEWNNFGISIGNSGFAQGVTFEELSSVGMMLQEESLEPSQKETAAVLIQKIQGTELFNLLENSMEGASRKMAELLDGRLSSINEKSTLAEGQSNSNDFDIREFA